MTEPDVDAILDEIAAASDAVGLPSGAEWLADGGTYDLVVSPGHLAENDGDTERRGIIGRFACGRQAIRALGLVVKLLRGWPAVRQEIDDLRDALKPFADFASPRVPASLVVTQGSSMARRQLTMADCQKAARALRRDGF